MTARGVVAAAAFVAFAILAPAHAGGYRYGISDQAFYAPAIARAIDPALFPRDAPLLETQTRLWLGDEVIGGIARATTDRLPALFAVLYAVTLGALAIAAAMLMRALGASTWATAGCLILLTLRHQITKTGANTLEGYMHPRLLAFACGLAAMALLVRRRQPAGIVALAAAAALHTTTALWFGVVVLAALLLRSWESHRARAIRWIAAGAVALVAIAAWAIARGPLAGSLAVMDADWLWVIEGRDYLFPAAWPWYAWAANFAYPVVIVAIFRRRRALGVAAAGERDVVAGLLTLPAIFLLAVPLTALHIALAVQLQVNRVFWLLDAMATAYVAWWLLDWIAPRAGRAARPVIAGLLVALSAARSVYVLHETGRPLAQIHPANAWMETMEWLRAQPVDWHVLADPQHAWKYGVSVRVAALRDTVLELSKDPAIAMYDRDIAARIAERIRALNGFEQFDERQFGAIDARYGVDVLVLDAMTSPLAFPVLYRNARFVVYDLR